MQHPEIPVLCGEYQGVIAKLRQEGYAVGRAEEAAAAGGAGSASGASALRARSLFCLREPGLFLEIFQIMDLKELRKDVSVLTAAACNVREKLRMYASMAREDDVLDPSEVLRPLLECIRSPSTTASVTSEALASVHRLVVALNLFKEPSERVERALHHVVEATVGCVFRQTESGDDEIAVMWALELLEACLACPAAASLSQRELEAVYVAVFKNGIVSSNADMLRRLASRKLASMISALFTSLYGDKAVASDAADATASKTKQRDEKLARRLFGFLCKRIDPNGPGWHEPELRQTSLDLVLSAIVSTIDANTGEVRVDSQPEIHALICDDLFRALLQTCQAACRPLTANIADRDVAGQDMVQVLPLPSSVPHKAARRRRKKDPRRKKSRSTKVLAGGANVPNAVDESQLAPERGAEEDGVQVDAAAEGEGATANVAAGASDDDDDDDYECDDDDDDEEDGDEDQEDHVDEARADSPFARIPSTFRELDAQYKSEALELMGSGGGRHGGSTLRVPLGLLSRALRVVHVLVSHSNTRRHLRVQMEAFCGSVFLRALEAKSKNTDNEARRLVLETLTDLFADQTVAVDIFCNFDCEVGSSNVLENLFVYLSNHSFPKQLRKLALDPLQLMSLRCIHLGVKSIAARSGEVPADKASLDLERMHDPEDLVASKRSKRRLQKCVVAFNRKPKAGVAALVDGGFVSNPPTPAELAAFLRNTQGLDKSMIGEYIGDYHDSNVAVLLEFVKTFHMDGMPLLSALRMFLESFRLPGEAQVIDRILQAFADRAHKECVDARTFPTVDCCFLMCFSIILLNTDLHNPNIRPEKKMSFDSFTLSNRNYGESVSKGQDMPLSLLRSIYDEIRAREINTMTDGNALTGEVTSDRWADLMNRPRPPLKLVPGKSAVCRLYDEQMFSFIHKPAFAALSVVYHAGDPTRQPRAVELALEGIMNCAETAARFGMVRVLDRIIVDVCKFTTLLLYAQASPVNKRMRMIQRQQKKAALPAGESIDTDIEDEDGDEAEETAVGGSADGNGVGSGGEDDNDEEEDDDDDDDVAATRARDAARDVQGSPNNIAGAMRALERSSKAQTATSSVVKIVLQHADAVRLAWPYIVYCLMRLFDLELLPTELLRESRDGLLDNSLRTKYHRISASAWVRNAETRTANARATLERSKGWVSWFNGESRAEAEATLHAREEELYTIKRAASFAAESIDSAKAAEPRSPASPQKRQQVRVETDKLGRFFELSRQLSEKTLMALVRGIIVASGGSESHLPSEDDLLSDTRVNYSDEGEVTDLRGDIRVDMLAPPSRASRLFGLHLLMEVALANEDRLELTWPMARVHLIKVLRSADHASCHTEKASIALLRLALRRLWEGGDDVSGALRFLLRLPSAVAPDFFMVVCDALVRAFDKPPADRKIWNEAISRTLVLISQAEDFGACLRGLQVLNKIFTHTRLVEANVQDLLLVHRAFVDRALAHRQGMSAAKEEMNSSELLTDLLNLLFILHSRLLESCNHDDAWFADEVGILSSLRALMEAGRTLDQGSMTSSHAAQLFRNAVMELADANCLTGAQWAELTTKALLTHNLARPIAAAQAQLAVDVLERMDMVISTLPTVELEKLCRSVRATPGLQDKDLARLESLMKKHGFHVKENEGKGREEQQQQQQQEQEHQQEQQQQQQEQEQVEEEQQHVGGSHNEDIAVDAGTAEAASPEPASQPVGEPAGEPSYESSQE